MQAEAYQLKSDLARVCLPNPQGHPDRVLAWVNSVCMLFLIVALTGANRHFPAPGSVPPLEQPLPVIIQPLQAPPPKSVVPQEIKPTEQETTAPRVVVVTPMSPAINFSVPTIGNVLVPNAIAQPPPAEPLKPATRLRAEPKSIGSTGEGGDRPQPPYPEMALKFQEQGTVVLLFTVDDSGIIQNISIKESSGSPILDRSTLEFIKRHWIVPPGAGGRVFQAAIAFQIKTD